MASLRRKWRVTAFVPEVPMTPDWCAEQDRACTQRILNPPPLPLGDAGEIVEEAHFPYRIGPPP
jgi:hypothetical protein